jgi:signal transduction histidine kinase
MEKIFDPFYSTKFIGRGLGLPAVLEIVRASNGVVTVESERGRGSVFKVFFPVLQKKDASVVKSVRNSQWIRGDL